jgi:hypothetical protein
MLYIKIAIFSFSSCLTIERSIKLWTGNVNRFRGFLVPRPDWIIVLYLFGTLGLRFASVNSQCLEDNKLAIPSYPVNKYILLTNLQLAI